MSSTSRPSTPISTSSLPINHPAHHLLTRAHSPTTATTLFTDKIKNKPLLLYPSSTRNNNNTSTNSRSLRRHIRLRKKQYHFQHQRPRPLSAKEKRQLNLYALDPATISYEIYRPLNRLWKGYILEVLGLLEQQDISNSNSNTESDDIPRKISPDVLSGKKLISPTSHGSLLASADFHGMEVEVVRSRDVGRVGLKGIVIRETRSTLAVATKSNRCVRVMKVGTVFRVVIDLVNVDDEENEEEEESTIAEGHAVRDSTTDHVSATATATATATTKPFTKSSNTSDQDQSTATTTNTTNTTNKPISPHDDHRKIIFELHGSQLQIRPVERAVRKFKWKSMSYL